MQTWNGCHGLTITITITITNNIAPAEESYFLQLTSLESSPPNLTRRTSTKVRAIQPRQGIDHDTPEYPTAASLPVESFCIAKAMRETDWVVA